MWVFLISPVPIAEPLTSELIDTPVFHNLAPRPIKYRVSVPIPTSGSYYFLDASFLITLLHHNHMNLTSNHVFMFSLTCFHVIFLFLTKSGSNYLMVIWLILLDIK